MNVMNELCAVITPTGSGFFFNSNNLESFRVDFFPSGNPLLGRAIPGATE